MKLQITNAKVGKRTKDFYKRKETNLKRPSVHGIFQARVLEWVAIAFSGVMVWSCLKSPLLSEP